MKSGHANHSKRGEDGYTAFARNVPLFHSLNEMPINLDPVRLDEGHGIEVTLRANYARYHKGCNLLFTNTKLQIAEKRLSTAHRSMTAAAVRRT